MFTPPSLAATGRYIMAARKPSSKAKSAGRKPAAAPQSPPKSHAVGKKRRGKTAAAHLRRPAIRNIIERRRAEAALRESEEKYRILFQTMAQGVVYQSADGKITSANPAAERILGLTLDQMRGRTSIDPRWRAIHEDGSDFPGRTHPSMVALQTGQEVRNVVMGFYNPRTESYVWININAVLRIEPGDDKPCQVYTTFEDITERKKAEDRLAPYQRRLRSVGAKLAVAEEQERRRIAAGLHDNVVQTLALAKMKLEGLARRKPAARLVPVLREARALVAQSLHDTRALLFDLSPVVLYELGFEPAVEALLERIQAAHRLATRFRTDHRPKPVTGDVRVVLFRGVREVLQNVVKHARARSVDVSVGRDGKTIMVEVQDDGVGFDTKEALSIHDADRGFGLFDVRERLDYLGGNFTIQSEPGKGTTVVLRVPLVPEKACPGGMSHGDSSASG